MADTDPEEVWTTQDTDKLGLTHEGRNRVAHGLYGHSIDKPEAF